MPETYAGVIGSGAMARTTKEQPKLYVIKKYVMARSVIEAARKEKAAPAHSIYIDEAWQEKNLAEAMGYAPKGA